MQIKLRPIGVALVSLFLIAACDSGTDSDASYDADSYEYKGAADPFLSIPAADRAGELGKRFDMIQGRM